MFRNRQYQIAPRITSYNVCYTKLLRREYYNYAVGLSSEPGSTFKLPVMVAVLEDGYVTATDSIATGKGVFEYYDLVVRDDNYTVITSYSIHYTKLYDTLR